MPRIPSGMHLGAGSVRAYGGRARRIQITNQADYWRQTDAELKAATVPVRVNSAGNAAAAVGPAGVGEVWQVSLVQVQVQPALLTNTKTIAQVWRGTGGITLNLLALTNNGGYDDLGVTGPPLRAGEQIIIIWSGATPGNTAWATIEGTKTVLEAYSGNA